VKRIVVFLLLIGCAGPPLDVALRGSATTAEPADAPFFVYDLVLAVDALDTERWDAHSSSLCDRTADEIDVLLRARGFHPATHESYPARPWVRLTLIRGRKRIALWAESRGSDVVLRNTYSGPADPVRATVDVLLGRMLADFAGPIRDNGLPK
jgi:hypothetical protein